MFKLLGIIGLVLWIAIFLFHYFVVLKEKDRNEMSTLMIIVMIVTCPILMIIAFFNGKNKKKPVKSRE